MFEAMASSQETTYIYACNMKTNWFRWSMNAVRYFNLPGEYMENVPAIWGERIHPDDRQMFFEDIDKVFAGEKREHCCEYRAKNFQGKYVWLRCHGFVSTDMNGEPDFFAGTIINLGQKTKFDAVTNMYSRFELLDELDRLSDIPDASGGLMQFDIDGFKHINDMYGYDFGNQVLGIYAGKLQSECSGDVSIYRVGGDCFCILYQGASREDMLSLYSRMQELSWNGIEVKEIPMAITVSASATMYPEDGMSPDVLQRNMDYAMDLSKKNGRNRLTFFTKDLHKLSSRNFYLQELLKKNIQRGYKEFYLCYQPILDKDGNVEGCEALLRWNSEEEGNISPAEFIPVLEANGLMYEAGKWVFVQALRQLKEWQGTCKDFTMNINISYQQFSDPRFYDWVMETIRASGVRPGTLVLELTESCKIMNFKSLHENLDRYRESGLKVALDDFGTGYAAINVLRELPVDWVKIDHTMVSKIAENYIDQAIIEYTIGLCRKIGIHVCVEGIENEKIRRVVKKFSPSALQGYYFSYPLKAYEFEKKYIFSKSE